MRLKKEYVGITVSRNHIELGTITFNTNTVEEKDYINYYNLGFEMMFEKKEIKNGRKKVK